MNLGLVDLINEASKLPLVPLKAATIYHEKIPLLKKYVDDILASHPSINKLIGYNPLQMMFDNHSHHASFMATVFIIGNYELLAKTVPWVYRAYSSHNFSYDYFPLELKTWIEAIERHMDPDLTAEIKSVYLWMINRHEDMIYLSQSEEELKLPILEDWFDKKNSFFTAALLGDYRRCLEITKESISTGKDIESFYLYIIQPVMYEVGMLWERGKISVAQEHLVSAIVTRVMAAISMMISPQRKKGKAVIASAPNEFHEIGAWMISDILEQDGWEVKYLGANTPLTGIMELLQTFKPHVLGLSVTMPFNILRAKEIIDKIKEDKELKKILVIIGGRVFNDIPHLWRSTGADYYATNALEVKNLLHNLRKS